MLNLSSSGFVVAFEVEVHVCFPLAGDVDEEEWQVSEQGMEEEVCDTV